MGFIMKYCPKCVMPDTKPGVTLNDEGVCPHAFPLILKDEKYNREKLYKHLESRSIQCKTLFGSLPTTHNAFEFMKYKPGDFPIAEYVGKNGLHFGIHLHLNKDDMISKRYTNGLFW